MNNRRIGFTCSAFDLLHAGHIEMLREAKSQCDYLICGLQTDPTIDRAGVKHKPQQSLVERWIQLNAVRYVDQIIPYETEDDLCNILKTLPINVRIIGDDYRDKDFTGKQICYQRGIVLYFNKRDHGFSTTRLINKIRGSW